MRGAVLFDRDGTLNRDVGHLRSLSRLEVYRVAPRAVGLARSAGFRTILVTNQSGVARGLLDESKVVAANRRVAEACGGFDGMYYCPHHPDVGEPPYRMRCACRKPRAGMLERAAAEHDFALERSFLIGDSASDLEAASEAGCGAVLVLTGHGRRTLSDTPRGRLSCGHVARDVLAAVRWVAARAREAG